MSEIKVTIFEQLQQLQMLTHRASFRSFMTDGKTHSPHRGQGRILAILKIKPEISQKDLTYMMGMSKQAIAQLLDKLEKNGYITRESSGDDRRVSIIKLTEEGVNATGDFDDEASDSAKFLDCLNDEELAVFSEYLNRIIKRYEEQFPDEDYEKRRKHMEQFMSRYGHGYEFESLGEHGDHPHGFGDHFGNHSQFHGHHHRGEFQENKHNNENDNGGASV